MSLSEAVDLRAQEAAANRGQGPVLMDIAVRHGWSALGGFLADLVYRLAHQRFPASDEVGLIAVGFLIWQIEERYPDPFDKNGFAIRLIGHGMSGKYGGEVIAWVIDLISTKEDKEKNASLRKAKALALAKLEENAKKGKKLLTDDGKALLPDAAQGLSSSRGQGLTLEQVQSHCRQMLADKEFLPALRNEMAQGMSGKIQPEYQEAFVRDLDGALRSAMQGFAGTAS